MEQVQEKIQLLSAIFEGNHGIYKITAPPASETITLVVERRVDIPNPVIAKILDHAKPFEVLFVDQPQQLPAAQPEGPAYGANPADAGAHTYDVIVKEVHSNIVRVKANSAQQAIVKVDEGEGEHMGDAEYLHMIPKNGCGHCDVGPWEAHQH
jgi:hypothetical protein